MLLSSLLKNVRVIKIVGPKDTDIREIYDDSRKVKKGGLFVAIKGLHVNSQKFIPEVISKGVKAVVSEDLPEKQNAAVCYIQVKDSRVSLGEIASNFYGNPSKRMKMIGVTGTKGKTTTVYMIYHILKYLGKSVGMVSSNEAKIGEKSVDTGFHVSNPEPLELHKLLAEMVKNGCKYAVIEVTSHGIAQKRNSGIDFDVAVLTNISPEHLDYHKTLAKYKSVKMSFLKSGKNKVLSPKKVKFHLFDSDFNNLNAEAAVKAVSYLGISRNSAIKALKFFKLPEGRLDEIKLGQDFRIFIDFAHTPDSFTAVLKYLKSQSKGKLITMFGSAGERDHQKRPKMGAVAAKYSDVIILTSEDPRSEDVNKIIDEISSGVLNKNFKTINYKRFHESIHGIKTKLLFKIPDREEAIAFALIKAAKEGDLVALLGKGHEKSMNLDGIHETPWSEHKIVRKYLKQFK